MHEDKKDKYKQCQTKEDTKISKKSVVAPGDTVKEQVDKVRKTNLKARAINDYAKSTGKEPTRNENRKAFRVNSVASNKPGQAISTAPASNKYKAEAGSGSIPSGTNTNVPGMIGRKKRKDGSYGC